MSAVPSLPRALVTQNQLEENIGFAFHERPDLREQLEEHVPTWVKRQDGFAWYRSNNGRFAVERIADPIDTPDDETRVVGSPVSDPRRKILTNVGVAGGPPSPIVLEGLESPESIIDLCQRFPRLPNQSWARIYVIDEDPHGVLDALATGSLAGWLGEDRLRFFVGTHARRRLVDNLRQARDEWSSLNHLPRLDRKPRDELREDLLTLTKERVLEYHALCAQSNAKYASRDVVWWRDRFQDALANTGRPLRVLIPTTLFSTYIQHSAADIADAIQANGFEARVVIEPDDSSLREGLSIARAVHDFEPDVILVVNYTRSTLGESVPRQIPHVCWLQDELAHMFSQDFARDVDPMTLLVGNIFSNLVSDFGVPADRCVRIGVPGSSSKFSADINDTPEYDLFIATNHGECPAAMSERLAEECAETGGPADLIRDIYQSIVLHLPTWNRGYLVTWLQRLIDLICEDYHIRIGSSNAAVLLRDVAIPIVNRLLRHRLIDWAIELAERDNLRIAIAGQGWDNHPRAAAHWIGQVPHGPALRDLYQTSLVTLQSSAVSLVHQRLHECLLAGSLPGLMLTPDDLFAILRPAQISMYHAEPTCSTIEDRRLRIRPWDDPTIAMSLSTAQRVSVSMENSDSPRPRKDRSSDSMTYEDSERFALDTGMLLWRRGIQEDYPLIRDGIAPINHARFIDSISPGMFATIEGLRALIKQAKENPSWRRAQIGHARAQTLSGFTYEHTAKLMLSSLADQLERSARLS